MATQHRSGAPVNPVKRAFDVVVASAVLVVMAAPMLAVVPEFLGQGADHQ